MILEVTPMTKIKIKDIIPFKNHPFKIEEDDSLKELMESINTTGLINPVKAESNIITIIGITQKFLVTFIL